MDMAVPIGGADLVHEIEEFDPPAPLVMTADDLTGRDVERSKERRRAVPFIIVRLASEGTPVRQFEIALRSLQSLDRRLFVDREHDRVLGRGHIEADDLGRFSPRTPDRCSRTRIYGPKGRSSGREGTARHIAHARRRASGQ